MLISGMATWRAPFHTALRHATSQSAIPCGLPACLKIGCGATR